MKIFRYPTTPASLSFHCKQGGTQGGGGRRHSLENECRKQRACLQAMRVSVVPLSSVSHQAESNFKTILASSCPVPLRTPRSYDCVDPTGRKSSARCGGCTAYQTRWFTRISPFAAEDFRQGVHDAVYRCVASNIVGSIISREVHVKAENVIQIRNLYCVAWWLCGMVPDG
ncbi:hypothetical protein CEXT_508101 [Caerostris extrusa]|uniref:Uncharacterized protein n=1 Tax=Caerostris extrusa TaxID=172846 RepID=A0AAV4Y0U8_CAEEX|nr:hypothetical protein CEXT_508101 [Caerostris extrusa]